MRRLLALLVALLVGAVPGVAAAAVPDPLPTGVHLGGLRLTPAAGTGADVPSFTAEHSCRPGTHLANVNAIDLAGVEQTLSANVEGDAVGERGFGAKFLVDMATAQAAAGTPGTAERFLFLVDCRTGAAHGTYTDAVIVEFDAAGGWRVLDSPAPAAAPGFPAGGWAGIAVALILVGAGIWYLRHRRTQKGTRTPS
ncbi:hypothetical protein [Dactylosporangium sp. NPDC051541]|uniref:hypothetical protein n=1 Tax=Dactylosporangium sp. NPDC051541 TaxID=3363977 RepID=UPI0037B92082